MRRLCAAVLVGVLSIGFAVPAYCANIVNIVPGPVKNNGTMLNIDIGNEIPRKVNLGMEIASIQGVYFCNHFEHCHNTYYSGCNQYLATNTYSNGCALPYSKVSTADPRSKAILTSAATALGYAPGDAFGLEIGTFTNGIGYYPCPSLAVPMNYEILARNRAGCVPGMLALLPNGAVTLLNACEFDQTFSNQWYVDGTRMYYLHTLYPDAVYMLVHIPV